MSPRHTAGKGSLQCTPFYNVRVLPASKFNDSSWQRPQAKGWVWFPGNLWGQRASHTAGAQEWAAMGWNLDMASLAPCLLSFQWVQCGNKSQLWCFPAAGQGADGLSNLSHVLHTYKVGSWAPTSEIIQVNLLARCLLVLWRMVTREAGTCARDFLSAKRVRGRWACGVLIGPQPPACMHAFSVGACRFPCGQLTAERPSAWPGSEDPIHLAWMCAHSRVNCGQDLGWDPPALDPLLCPSPTVWSWARSFTGCYEVEHAGCLHRGGGH